MEPVESYLEDGPLWYKDAIIYELHIRSFYDSNSDGIGDFQGATEKLGYLQDLGVTALWLLPFYPSPLKDDGYDITDYFSINPDYGDLRSFRKFLNEAHRRGMRVITELVLNHTSDQHPWFQKSRQARPGTSWRNFYVWSDTPERYKDARIIFQDFEKSNWTWDPVAKAYYWHRFYHHQPDLNYDNPQVQKAMFRAIDFWFGLGVDGMRLDAVPYLYEREGTNCENLPETHAFLKKLRAHIDGTFKDKMILGEANQWPEDAAAYFGGGDECNMAFHFPMMPRMFMAVQMEDRFPIVDIIDQTPAIPDNCQWALFLRNHDELTLEMVTDEERDYMYRVYAHDPRAKINLGIRRRLSPLLGNNRRKIELMNVLLFALKGTPVIYYGDEIGMGDNFYLGDRNGVRTPMQWSRTRNAGFSEANPQKLYLPVITDPEYHYEAVNVVNQERDPFSLLRWMKQTVALRARFKAFGRGDLEVLYPSNPKIFAFLRQYLDETILVVTNLSRFTQYVELNLNKYAGKTPFGLFSGNRFHVIEDRPYPLTIGPYDYYWFAIKPDKEAVCVTEQGSMPLISVREWSRLMEEGARSEIENEIIPNYLRCCSWFGGRRRTVRKVNILEEIPVSKVTLSYILILEINYTQGLPELYLLPLSFMPKEKAETLREGYPQSLVAGLHTSTREGVMYDGIYDRELSKNLIAMVLHRRRAKGERGELIFRSEKAAPRNLDIDDSSFEIQILKSGQGMAVFQLRDRFFLKVYRQLEDGVNHDLEMTRFLTRQGFVHIPPFLGDIEYRQEGFEPISIGMLQGFVQSEGDAWEFTSDEIGRYFDRVLSKKDMHPPQLPGSVLDVEPEAIPDQIRDLMGSAYIEMVQLIGMRTAKMHLALSSGSSDDPAFAPEPFSELYQRSIYQSMRTSATRIFQSLEDCARDLPEELRSDLTSILASRMVILSLLQNITSRKIDTTRIRVHGDYRLEQLLYTGKDFYIFEFDSRPGYLLAESRVKRSPIRDVASMIISICFAASCAMLSHASTRPEDLKVLKPWTRLWSRYASGIFVRAYMEAAGGADFVPRDRDELKLLLEIFLLDRSIHELGGRLDTSGSVEVPLLELRLLLDELKKEVV